MTGLQPDRDRWTSTPSPATTRQSLLHVATDVLNRAVIAAVRGSGCIRQRGANRTRDVIAVVDVGSLPAL